MSSLSAGLDVNCECKDGHAKVESRRSTETIERIEEEKLKERAI